MSKDSQKTKTNNNDEKISVFPSMKFPLIIAQYCGFFPIQGLYGGDSYKSLKFSWYSIQMLYCLTILSTTFILILAVIRKLIVDNSHLLEFSLLVFTTCGALDYVFFMQLARNWPQLMHNWRNVEIQMKQYGIRTNLKLQIQTITFTFLSVAIIEHLLVQITRLVTVFNCTRTVRDGLEYFFVNITLPVIFSVIDYSLWIGCLFQFILLLLTFSWNFIDIFIILISRCLAFRLQQLNYKLETIINAKVIDIIVWKTLREEHYRLYELCSLINRNISNLILLSYFSNLYFTLLQLFSTLGTRRVGLEKIYFLVSFSLLITRLVCVCLFGASVYEENRKILPLLLTVKSNYTNFEVKRFIDQAHHIVIVLSGWGFFRITKTIILNIAGAIVTYLLVLIQFNGPLLQNKVNVDTSSIINETISSIWLC